MDKLNNLKMKKRVQRINWNSKLEEVDLKMVLLRMINPNFLIEN